MPSHWSENPPKIGGSTRVLVPGHQKSGALPSCPTGFFYLKNGLQKYEFLLFAKCLYMCFTQNLVILEHCHPKMSMHWWEIPPKKGGGTRVLVPGHQKSGAPPSWITGFLFSFQEWASKLCIFVIWQLYLCVLHKTWFYQNMVSKNERAVMKKKNLKK